MIHIQSSDWSRCHDCHASLSGVFHGLMLCMPFVSEHVSEHVSIMENDVHKGSENLSLVMTLVYVTTQITQPRQITDKSHCTIIDYQNSKSWQPELWHQCKYLMLLWESNLFSTFVIPVLYTISFYIGPYYIHTQIYLFILMNFVRASAKVWLYISLN